MSIQIFQSVLGPLGENTYLLRDGENGACAVIDPGCWDDRLRMQIERSEGLTYILLTHAHADHIAAINSYRRAYPAAQVIVGAGDEGMLSDADINHSKALLGSTVSCEADRIISDGDVLPLGTLELRFIATPGHTPGGLCIYTEEGDERVLFSGDTLFQLSVGRTDFPGGSWPQLKSSIQDKLFQLPPDTLVYPGHGPATSIAREIRENCFV